MNLDPFEKHPFDPFKSKHDFNPSAPKDIFAKPKFGGGTGGPRKVEPVLEPLEPASEPVAPEPEKPKPSVILRNLKWDREKGAIGSVAFATMDVDIPSSEAHLTRVICTVQQLMPNGTWQPNGSTPCNADQGHAKCEITLPVPIKNKDGSTPSPVFYHFSAKHSHSEEAKGPRLEATPASPESPFESIIFYSPTRQEYLVFDTEEEYKDSLPELDRLNGLKGKSRQLLEATNPSVRKKLQTEIDEETKKLWDDEVIGEADVMEELLLVRRNPKWGKPAGWVYIRPYPKKNGTTIKGHWRGDSDATLKKNLAELLKKAPGSKEHSPLFESQFKLKLFSEPPLKSERIFWRGDKDKEGTVGGQPFTFSKKAAVCRLMMNWDGVDSSIDLKEKKIRIGTGGSLSFGLLEGKVEGKFPLPEKGVNLLEFIRQTTVLGAFIAEGRTCLLRLKVTLSAQAFAGLTVSGAFNLLEVDLSKQKPAGKKQVPGPTASTNASANASAVAQAGVGLDIATEWARRAGEKFEELGSCGVESLGSAGLGAGVEWKIEYRNGTFHFKAGTALTIGLGYKGSFTFELSLQEGWKFVGYLLHNMDFHFVSEIDKDAFKAYKNYAFTLMTLGEQVFTAEKAMVTEVITDFTGWLKKVKMKTQDANRAMLSSMRSSSRHSSALNNVPPEALGQALITIMVTREEDDFRSIMVILYSTVRRGANVKTDPSANHKLKWTLRAVSGILDADGDAAASDMQKGEAVKLGIERIEDFGKGIGYVDAKGNKAERNSDFIKEFKNWLQANGVHGQ